MNRIKLDFSNVASMANAPTDPIIIAFSSDMTSDLIDSFSKLLSQDFRNTQVPFSTIYGVTVSARLATLHSNLQRTSLATLLRRYQDLQKTLTTLGASPSTPPCLAALGLVRFGSANTSATSTQATFSYLPLLDLPHFHPATLTSFLNDAIPLYINESRLSGAKQSGKQNRRQV